jgi:hypothetical protein
MAPPKIIIHKLINSIWNKEELPEQWKESFILPICKKGDKTGCNNYSEVLFLSTSYKMLPNTLLSKLSPYIDQIIGDHQCGFPHNKSTTDQIFCICQILEKKWEYNESVHQIFIDFKKANDSVRREVLHNILIEFGVPLKLVRLIKMCLNETCIKISIGIHFSNTFHIKNGLNQGDALSPLLFKFALEYAFRKVETHKLLAYADGTNLLRDNRYYKEKHRNFNWC